MSLMPWGPKHIFALLAWLGLLAIGLSLMVSAMVWSWSNFAVSMGLAATGATMNKSPLSNKDVIWAAQHFVLPDGIPMWVTLARLERDLPLEVTFGKPEILNNAAGSKFVGFPYWIGTKLAPGDSYGDLLLEVIGPADAPRIALRAIAKRDMTSDGHESASPVSADDSLARGYRALFYMFHKDYVETCIDGKTRTC